MDDPATTPEPNSPPPKSSSGRAWDRARLVDLGLEAVSLSMLAFIATGLVVWSGRREISRELAEAWLRDHGIEAAVELDDLDATGFTGKIRLGARDNPVFSADRLEVAYDLAAPWNGEKFGVQTRAVRLVRPRVLASIDAKGQVRFGALQPLIDEALKSPRKPNVPGPAILVEDARLDLITPGGRARITGDASLDDGQLLRLDGRLAPLRYAVDNLALDSKGATVSARKRGDRLTIEVSVAIDSLDSETADLAGAAASLSADLPYPDLAKLTASGPLEARLAVRADGGRLGDGQARTLAGDLALAGRIEGGLDNFAFLGRARGGLRGARLSAPSLDARDASLALELTRVSAGRAQGRVTARGAASAELRAGEAVAGGAALRGLRAGVRSDNLGLTLGGGTVAVDGPLAVDAEAARLAGGALALASARLNARGRIDQGAQGLTLALDGSAGGRSGISGPDAERLAALIPNPAYGKPLSQALRTFDLSLPAVGLDLKGGRTRVTLAKEARLSAPNGVVLSANAPKGLLLDAGPDGARGGLQAALSGGGLPVVKIAAPTWRAKGGVVTSPLSIATDNFDLPPIQGVSGKVDGQARIAGGRFTLTTAKCVPITAKAYALGENPVTDVKASLCPAKAPLVAAGANGWSAALRFENGEGALAVAEAKLQNVKGEATFGGTGGFDRASVRVDGAAVTDAAPERRFNSILAKGGLTLSGGVWGGTFQATTPVGAPLGEIRLRHVVATGKGRADIDASKLAFAKGGLQPAELSPMAAFAKNAQGPASFTGVFAWDAQGATSRGRLVVDRMDFTSPIGFVATLDGAVAFDSLAPLTTAPNQTLKIVRIDSLVPLTAIESVFQLGADALHISKATFEAAKGRISIEPTDVPFEPGKTISGVIVIEHLDLGEVLAASSLADKVKAQAVVDGRLPFTFGPEGLRFQQGKIQAIQPGRIELSRAALTSVEASPTDSPGAPPSQPAQVNAIQDFAYQAMENLAFDQLEAGVNSTDKGRLGVLFHIKGEHDPKVAEKARVGILDLLRGKAFNKRIALPAKTPVDLTLDTSLNFDELLAAWRRSFAEEEATTTESRSGPVQP
ncbi:YdbH domain-containing protein [Caulobacter segnis]|uniref:intermembrane phospholipid transport protein YdbH family protein n=1 Tax=Caulobacter segnis TaxID=88688 RepID=UPI001CBDCCFA|nr:YdbH domain-containing protein [Caulobacter segnis]UAL10478.1 YdbH domain-containing protein [Caulobacter segnis]